MTFAMSREKIVVLDGGRNAASRKRKGGGGGGSAGGDGGFIAPDDWRRRLQRNVQGQPKACIFNVLLILEHDADLAGLFWLDEFGNRVVLDRHPPWPGGSQLEFTEADATELAGWLGEPERYGATVKADLVMECVETIARRRKRHTVREYLERLQWDGVPRIGRMFVDLFGAQECEYALGVGPCFMVSAVSRILWRDAAQPTKGSKVDFMLVMEGQQGAGKTTAVLELFGADWYAEAMESPTSKDFYQSLRGRWGVEIGEMDSFTKADVTKVKQAITSRHDTYRPSYGRTARSFRRECVFVGTTNKDDYLRDETGGRRFLPLKVGSVDLPAVIAARDQLWAEAVHLFRDGFRWWDLPAHAVREQEARYSEDVWTERVWRWVNGKCDPRAYEHIDIAMQGPDGPIEFTLGDVLLHGLHVDVARQDRSAQTRVGAILKRLGFSSWRSARLGGKVSMYYRDKAGPDG